MVQTSKDVWDAKLYDQSHAFVSQYGNHLIELLAPKEGERILDLGCGTGDLANKLHNIGVNVIGVDKSENMIVQAKSKYSQIEFSVQDATDLTFNQEFDAVFSNATLHWVQSPLKALTSIYNSIKKGGRFVAEFGGKGNVQTIVNAIINKMNEEEIPFQTEKYPWYYPSIGEYTNLMEQVGFRVTFAQHFDRPTPLQGEAGLANWINMFGSNLLEGIEDESKERIISKVEQALKTNLYQNGQWIADYKRIRVMGIKE